MMTEERKRLLFNILGVLISVFFLYLTFRNTDFAGLSKNLKIVSIPNLLGALLCTVGFFVTRGGLQWVNLNAIKPGGLSFSHSTAASAYGVFFNGILPSRIGEFIRVFYLSRHAAMRRTSVLTYVVLERILDMIFLIMLLGIVVLAGFGKADVRNFALLGTALILLAVLGLFIFVRWNSFFLKLVLFITPSALRERVQEYNIGVVEGLRVIRGPAQGLAAAGYFCMSWVFVAGIYWCMADTYTEALALPAYGFIVLMAFSTLSMTVPSAPAGIGVVHYGLYLAVGVIRPDNIPLDESLAAAFVVFLHLSILITDLSVSGLLILGLGWFNRNTGSTWAAWRRERHSDPAVTSGTDA